jgi:hypothetical protein
MYHTRKKILYINPFGFLHYILLLPSVFYLRNCGIMANKGNFYLFKCFIITIHPLYVIYRYVVSYPSLLFVIASCCCSKCQKNLVITVVNYAYQSQNIYECKHKRPCREKLNILHTMADVLELENAEEFEDDSISRMKASPFLRPSFQCRGSE